MGSDRIIRFALESGFGVMALLLLCIVALYVRFIQNAHAVLSVHKLRLDEAQRLARVGSWELDLTSGQMKWSAQIYRIFHMEPTTNNPTLEEFLGQIQEADKSAVRKIMEGGSDLKEHVECSVGILRMTGDSGRVRLKLEEVTGQTGLVEGLIGTLSDITEQELLESELRRAKIEAESASRLKSDFIANISHELKTPMNSILGRSQIALQGDLGSTAKIHIQTVHKSAEHLLSIINEILDFSKLEANKYVVEKRGFSLLEVTRKLQDQLLPLAREKDLKFQMDTPSNLPTRLVGDPEQLGKVLSALATNSIKFTQEGRVSMGIETGLQTGTAIELHFWVNDTGIGMTPGQQANLFQAFSQVDSSRTRKFGGTGLGLVISKRIVEMMGGRIWIQSIFGTGTTVHVVIPFEKVAQSKVAASLVSVARPVAEQRSHANLSDTQVLLVEDSSINQELAKRLLAKFDVAVTLATNGQEALDILSTKIDFDAILMDCHMPVMDGYTATREVRKINALNGIPVIALTANVSANDRAKMSASGMCDVVAKPYTAQELIDVLFRWVAPKNRTTQRSSDREAQPSTADFMPPVPGINVPYGLNIAMSDVNLYKRLLQMFGQSEVNFAQKFKSARQSGDGASATRLAHSLKGVSGSIGAKDVQAAALSLESACHKGLSDADIRPLLDTTLEALKQVLDGLGVLNEPCADSDAPLWDSMRVNILVVHLEELIAQQDLCVYDIVEDLALATNGSSISTAVNKVVKAIERFDLVLAQQELKHVSVALKGL
jgi:signal transduction histidine kinase/CheY-like chemotaxis protein/HPt (histidine-containing phosphotransfer) domain-containing protein